MITTILNLVSVLLFSSLARSNYDNNWYIVWITTACISSVSFAFGVILLLKGGFTWL